MHKQRLKILGLLSNGVDSYVEKYKTIILCSFIDRWRIVIHGGIDGFSRMIVYLKASASNRADTVFNHFLNAVEEFGLPSRIRSDKGGENVDIARYMLGHPLRGPDRGSHITGRSVHNQRIERLWRDLFYGCTHSFYTLFYAMEDAGLLDPSNEFHLYALHYVFLPRLNQRIAEFVDAHTRAPISTEHNKSPLQLWISGLLNVWNSTSQIAVEQSMVGSDYFALCLILAGMTPLADPCSVGSMQAHSGVITF